MICTIIGSGTWGSALAQVLADNNHKVTIYGVDKIEIEDISQNHKNSKYFGDEVILDESIIATSNLIEALNETEVIVLAVPTIAIRSVLKQIKPYLINKPYIVSVAKGFDPDTFERMSEVIRSEIPSSLRQEVVSLIGPGHAEEVILKKLTCVTSTSIDKKCGEVIQKLFSTPYFRVYVQTDEIGAEYGVAIKNAIAIASGISQGIGMGDNAKAALATRGLVEMIRFGTHFGGQISTFMGLTGIGDLMVTCNSEHSRNFQAGYQIGKANSAIEFLKNNKKTVEGIRTAKIIHDIAKEKNINMPIIDAVYEVLYEEGNPIDIVYKLMTRELKKE